MPSPGLANRAAKAKRALEKLRRLAQLSWEEYSASEDYQALAERYMHIFLEALLDLASFVAVRQKRLKGATYRDAMEAVLDLIPPELRPIAKGVPGMRNILVHGYADVRHDLLYETMREELGALEAIFDVLWREAEQLDC